ncbi:hypothetical protein KM043_014204 [Ampulex compressa]|nr:hypothetical protein KM043_014204 [Ampulex compressa]
MSARLSILRPDRETIDKPGNREDKRSSGEKTKRHVLSFEIWNASRNSSLEGFCAGSTILATFKLDENPDASTTENLQGTWRSFEHT